MGFVDINKNVIKFNKVVYTECLRKLQYHHMFKFTLKYIKIITIN